MLLLASADSFVWMDVIFACLMLTTGFVTGWWVTRTLAAAPSEDQHAQKALNSLRQLASSVAEDVGQHARSVQKINTDLDTARSAGNSQLEGQVVKSVSEILEANERLQMQLATAEVKLQQQAQELETQTAVARTDALTLLANRRAFDDEMSRRYAEWQRRGTLYSLLLMDVDHFKKFNDTHGHQAGDEVLKGVARVLTETMREMDLVARYGGEEFAVVLPVTNLAESLRAAERARVAIAAATFEFEGKQLKVTCSIGCAQMISSDTTAMLVKRVDEALYGSKAAGRNCVHFHDGEQVRPALETPTKPQLTAPTPAAQKAPKTAEPAPVAPARPVRSIAMASGDVPNLASFYTDLRRRVIECQRFNVPLSLLLVDVDNYEGLTERLGAASGEMIFQAISEFLDSSLGEMDIASRYGHGQFAVMAPGSNAEAAVKMAEAIRTTMGACTMQLGGADLRITVSLGLVEATAGDDATTLIERADAALRAAREAGRNCTYVNTGEGCELAGLTVATA